MVGSAVETIVWSSAASSMPSSNAPRITHRRRLVIVSAMGGVATALTPTSPTSATIDSE